MALKYHSRAVLIVGYLIFAWGALSIVADFVAQARFSFPLNMGIVLGNGAITLIGLVTQMIAKCLRKLEERLERIEKATPTAR